MRTDDAQDGRVIVVCNGFHLMSVHEFEYAGMEIPEDFGHRMYLKEEWCIGKVTGQDDEIYAAPDAFHVDEFKDLILKGEGSARIGPGDTLEVVPHPEYDMVWFRLSIDGHLVRTWDATMDELRDMQEYIRGFDEYFTEDRRRAMEEVVMEAMSPRIRLDPDAERRTREALGL